MMIPSEIALWFAVQVVPRHEFKVSFQLRLKGEEEFLPTVATQHQWSDRKKIIDHPLFPGYVFCRVTRSSFGTVLRTPGVYRFVGFGGKPHPISDAEICSLRHVVVSGRDLASVPYMSLGQKVRVEHGPLCGVTGIVTRFNNRNRLIISVDLLMKSIAVDVAISEVTALEAVPLMQSN